ncbi:MAG: hypothetical protein MI864_19435 [Pseudomonadales bacterium]|nr:hypothetical protein [Pseudomonadales bacterium]
MYFMHGTRTISFLSVVLFSGLVVAEVRPLSEIEMAGIGGQMSGAELQKQLQQKRLAEMQFANQQVNEIVVSSQKELIDVLRSQPEATAAHQGLITSLESLLDSGLLADTALSTALFFTPFSLIPLGSQTSGFKQHNSDVTMNLSFTIEFR